MAVVVRVVDVYVYRDRPSAAPDFLLLRRAEGRAYARQWRMVGGKIEPGEAAWQAALREVREEVGRAPVRCWALPSVNTFYEWQEDRVNVVPAFAVQIEGDPVLDDEHDAWEWLPAPAAAARLRWPEQERLLRLAAALLEQEVLPQWEVALPDEPASRPGW